MVPPISHDYLQEEHKMKVEVKQKSSIVWFCFLKKFAQI